MIYLTEAAISRSQKYLKANPSAIGIRINITRSGCSGYGYHIDLADAVTDNDTAFTYPDFQVVIKTADLPLVDGLKLDIKKQGLNESFSFDNPQAQATCGCGTSFSI